ncbi:hypothetical protein VNO78_03655 [Psophocarpus tetragonolobus]|uniref:Tunicamycin induced 1 n=1 Tax=Psophocarpus tetragonolobus TaxID=3891 RepID=A0AAN9TEI9_PSOTE
MFSWLHPIPKIEKHLRYTMKLLLCLGIAFLLLHSSHASDVSYPKAFSDLKDSIVKGFGFTAEDEVKITGFDPRDAQVGHSVEYQFDLQIDHQVIPFKLLEEVKRWDYVDLPIFRAEAQTGLVPKRASGNGLAPFVLAGPMELWIHDANDMKLSLPHDVDAGVLKKVVLAEGAAVIVKGARSVSLRQPLDFPLPLNRTENGFANGLLTLAQHLRHASRTQASPILSLQIVGPTSLAALPSDTRTSLKLKRLAPGLVELSSPLKAKEIEPLSSVDLQGGAPTILTPTQFSTLWPLASLNGSNANLLGFEKLLHSVLGAKAEKKGSFRLLKADVSAQTYVKIGFKAEKKLKEGELDTFGFPVWRTKPETVTTHFEVLAKVDGDKVVPEKVMPVKPVIPVDNVAQNLLTGNVSMSKTQLVHPPPNPFYL